VLLFFDLLRISLNQTIPRLRWRISIDEVTRTKHIGSNA
jgi:hypothetical protein